jgi:N-methylhydantoinase A
VRVGIDVGGTFTDLLAVAADGRLVRLKVASTPRAPELGALAALTALLGGVDAADLGAIVHASTIATNALLGQLALDLPRVAFITTEGFRDVLEIGRQNRSAIYDLGVRRARPLARREDRLVVRERREADGRVSTELDAASVERAIDAIAERGIASVAIGLLHADVDDAHELAIARRVGERLPDVAITTSAELVREFREYERFSTAVVNAALLPIVGGYLRRLVSGVRERGVGAPVFVMRSDGGMASIDAAARRPASLIESGPAAGVIAAAHLGAALGLERVLSFDMGGTTAKAGTIVGGRPEVASEFEAAGATHSGRAQKGSGYPVRFPFIDLAEVSAGGGTIAWIDAAGLLRVGPLSAGAEPGPACYGAGSQPTVTDANVVLGRLDPRALLGGSFPIDAERARRAVASVAAPTGGDVVGAAAGIVALVDAEMAKVLRIVSVERGYDPRDFTLLAFGGGGPLHACAVAADVGVGAIVVPPLPGMFSAFGLLVADVRVALTRSVVAPAERDTWPRLEAILRDSESAADRELADQGVAPAARRFTWEIDLRYAGQSFELTLPYAATAEAALAAFHARHTQRYGFCAADDPVVVVTARVIGIGVSPTPPPVEIAGETAGAPTVARTTRDVFGVDGFVATPIFDRDRLGVGATIVGPALVDQYDTTTYVAAGWSARVDRFGNLLLAATAVGAAAAGVA